MRTRSISPPSGRGQERSDWERRGGSATVSLEMRSRGPLGVSARTIAKVARAALGKKRLVLSILVTTNSDIRRLNKKFRGKDEATNVLSFPQDPPLLGDVVISADYCAKQGRETGSGFRYTFLYYLVHGILHLLGHDHEKAADAKKMYALTERILEKAGVA